MDLISSGFILLVAIFFIWALIRLFQSDDISPKQQYGIASTTQTGTPVRSYREKRIADYFTKNNINYEYEPVVWGGHYNHKQIHPDFYLPDYNLYVEYWGLVDVPDERKRSDYIQKMKWKMAQYHRNNIKFVSIYPRNLDSLDSIFPRKFEEETGIKFPYPTILNASFLPEGSLIRCRHCNGLVHKGDHRCGLCGNENP